MENSYIGENEERAFEIKYNPAGQELLCGRYRRASCCDVEYFFSCVQEGTDERNFREQLSLAFFHASLVNVFMVRKKNVGINGQAKDVLTCQLHILVFLIQ